MIKIHLKKPFLFEPKAIESVLNEFVKGAYTYSTTNDEYVEIIGGKLNGHYYCPLPRQEAAGSTDIGESIVSDDSPSLIKKRILKTKFKGNWYKNKPDNSNKIKQ